MKGGANWQSVPPCDVERACRYITDDGTVAAYFRIPRETVQSIRAGMKKPTAERQAADPISAGDTEIRRKAEDGSTRLSEAIDLLFERFAHRNGLTIEKAQELQLDGYRA